jgi:hypothetical protein
MGIGILTTGSIGMGIHLRTRELHTGVESCGPTNDVCFEVYDLHLLDDSRQYACERQGGERRAAGRRAASGRAEVGGRSVGSRGAFDL